MPIVQAFSRSCAKCGNRFQRLGRFQKFCLSCMSIQKRTSFIIALKNKPIKNPFIVAKLQKLRK